MTATGANPWEFELPRGWRRVRLKYVASLKGRLGWQNLRAEEYTVEGPYLVTSEHFVNDRVNWWACHHVTSDRYEMAPEIQLKDADLLMMKDGAAMGKLAYIDSVPGPACLNSHLLLFRPKRSDFLNRFLYYVLRSPSFASYMVQFRTGTTFFGISQESIGEFPLSLPTLLQQHNIVGFLDRKSDEIDAVIVRKQRIIDLLREERQAFVSHVVTKSLDLSVPTQDDEQPWLGVAPAHWQVARLKTRMLGIEQGWSPQCNNQPAEIGEWGVLKVGCMNSGVYDESENKALPSSLSPLPELEIQVGDVLMSRSNTLELVGAVGIVHRTQGKILLCDKLYRLRFDATRLLPAYAVHLLRSHPSRLQIERDASGASPSMKNISNDIVGGLMFAFPPVAEQQAICDHIDTVTSRINGQIEKNEQQIAKLREYRLTLISTTVTGKFSVPIEETPDFRAAVLAAEVVHRLYGTDHLGKTKLHKAIYGAEHDCDLVGLGSDYARMPFGPYDARLQAAVERELEARQWYKPVRGERGKVSYVALTNAGQHRPYFDRMYGDKAAGIARLIDHLRDLNKNKVERAMTLYAAWNDFLIRGEPVDDERLLDEVQKHWHPEKKHKEASWRQSLAWLKVRKVTPHGFGKPTRPTGALTGLRSDAEDESGENDGGE